MPSTFFSKPAMRAHARFCYSLPAVAMSLVVVPLAGELAAARTAATKQGLACPERIRTLAVTPTDPARIAGFETVIGGPTSSQSFLQDVEISTGSDAPLTGRADGKKKITWTFDGTAEVNVSCLYEGGVRMTRAIGRPKSCAAAILRSKDAPAPGPSGWGMERASLRCR